MAAVEMGADPTVNPGVAAKLVVAFVALLREDAPPKLKPEADDTAAAVDVVKVELWAAVIAKPAAKLKPPELARVVAAVALA